MDLYGEGETLTHVLLKNTPGECNLLYIGTDTGCAGYLQEGETEIEVEAGTAERPPTTARAHAKLPVPMIDSSGWEADHTLSNSTLVVQLTYESKMPDCGYTRYTKDWENWLVGGPSPRAAPPPSRPQQDSPL